MAEAIPFRLFTGYKGCVYHTVVNVVYRTSILYRTRMVCIRYVPYAYGMFFCTIRVYMFRTV